VPETRTWSSPPPLLLSAPPAAEEGNVGWCCCCCSDSTSAVAAALSRKRRTAQSVVIRPCRLSNLDIDTTSFRYPISIQFGISIHSVTRMHTLIDF
jgi:hypothetical protein